MNSSLVILVHLKNGKTLTSDAVRGTEDSNAYKITAVTQHFSGVFSVHALDMVVGGHLTIIPLENILYVQFIHDAEDTYVEMPEVTRSDFDF